MSEREIMIAPGVEFVRVEGDFVLMDLRQGRFLGLDPVASRLWQSFSDHGDLTRSVEELCREFAVEPEQARADAERWLTELARDGLVVVTRR